MPKKLKLNDLKVKSFTTALSDEEKSGIKGKSDTWIYCTKSKLINCTVNC